MRGCVMIFLLGDVIILRKKNFFLEKKGKTPVSAGTRFVSKGVCAHLGNVS